MRLVMQNATQGEQKAALIVVSIGLVLMLCLIDLLLFLQVIGAIDAQ